MGPNHHEHDQHELLGWGHGCVSLVLCSNRPKLFNGDPDTDLILDQIQARKTCIMSVKYLEVLAWLAAYRPTNPR